MNALLFILILVVIFAVPFAFILMLAYPHIVKDAEDCARAECDTEPAYTPLPTFHCAACGSGPWAGEWAPLARPGRQLCPNCSGAD